MPKKLTTEEFIEKARKVHGDKYDYSKVEYVNNRTKVCIICPEHGEFYVKPCYHLEGQKCPICAGKKITTNDFINRAKEIHNDKYDYSNSKYINQKVKLCIICPEHGEFWQTPHNHLKGHGCPKCCKTGVKYTTEEFIKKIKEIYGNKIIIPEKFEYINSHKKLKFICAEHGEFWQRPNDILNLHSCPSCGRNKVKNKLSLTLLKFIEKANQVHNNEYDYSLSEYNGYEVKTKIICHKRDIFGKEHGIFLQTPHSHLSGRGCPLCKMSSLERKIYNELTKNKISFEYEKHFKWLGRQSLDFYLPDYNIAIECQGIQHFEPCNFGSKVKTPTEMFNYVKSRDEKKYNMCLKNGIKLLYYKQCKLPYWIKTPSIYFSSKKILIKQIINEGKYEQV